MLAKLTTLFALSLVACLTVENNGVPGATAAQPARPADGAADASIVVDADGASETHSEELGDIYYGACALPIKFAKLQVFSFYTRIVTKIPGTSGQITLSLRPMRSSTELPPTISQTLTVGERSPATLQPFPLGAVGDFSLALGTWLIPAEANPESGEAVRIDDASLHGFFFKENMCAHVEGHVTAPTDVTIAPPARYICRFAPVHADGDIRPVVGDMSTCEPVFY